MHSIITCKSRDAAIGEAWRAVLDAKPSKGIMRIGLGSGTTIIGFVESGKEYMDGIDVVFVPTSLQAKLLLIENNLPIGDLFTHGQLDVAVDGCDYFDGTGGMIKGGGGCMLQEKMVAQAANKLIIIASQVKYVHALMSEKIPLEVHPLALFSVQRLISESIDGATVLRREFNGPSFQGKIGPVITDSGNLLVDLAIDTKHTGNVTLEEVNQKLLSVAGILETGLFLEMDPTMFIFPE